MSRRLDILVCDDCCENCESDNWKTAQAVIGFGLDSWNMMFTKKKSSLFNSCGTSTEACQIALSLQLPEHYDLGLGFHYLVRGTCN